MIDKDAKYEEVFASLEELVRKIEDPSEAISSLAPDMKRALEMIAWCREKLRGMQEELDSLLEESR